MSRIQKALEKSKKIQESLFNRGAGGPATRAANATDRGVQRKRSSGQDDTLARFHLNKVSIDPVTHRKRRIVLGVSGETAKTAYNVLRTRILQRMRTNGWNKLAISSAGAADGKTLTAINLGISMARQANQRVVLIDFDLQRPTISTYLGLQDADHNLGDYILGKAAPEHILQSTSIENLWVIPNKGTFQNSSEVLASDKIADLIKWIDTVDPNCVMLLDLPPLLVSDDVLAVSPLFDALLLVLAEGQTSRESARNTRELIEDYNIHLLGTVLNKSSDRIATYKY